MTGRPSVHPFSWKKSWTARSSSISYLVDRSVGLKTTRGPQSSRPMISNPTKDAVLKGCVCRHARQRRRRRGEQSHQDEHRDDLTEDNGHDEHRMTREELLRPGDSGEEERYVSDVARDEH